MKLLSNVKLDDAQRARLREIAPGVEVGVSAAATPAELARDLDVDTDILYSFRVPKGFIERAPNISWIQLLSAGCDHLNGVGAIPDSVRVTTCSGIHATPIAEHVLTMMLALYRRLPMAIRGQMNTTWIPQREFSHHVRELRSRTIGIIGYGSIGREVARLAKTFGTRILAVKRDAAETADAGYCVAGSGDPDGSIPERVVGPDALLEILPECDVVVLAVPLCPSTVGLVGARELDSMKPGSYLINIARGAVVDEAALIERLDAGTLAGAALDVFETEPLPEESPLWAMENVIVTPHISGASRPYLRRAFEVLAENLRRMTEGESLLNQVDFNLGY